MNIILIVIHNQNTEIRHNIKATYVVTYIHNEVLLALTSSLSLSKLKMLNLKEINCRPCIYITSQISSFSCTFSWLLVLLILSLCVGDCTTRQTSYVSSN